MCGITGFLDCRAKSSNAELRERARAMASTIAHRGPDDAGTWTDVGVGLGLGFRRLAIIDLSHHGHQPMISSSGRFVLVFNGEIYNFRGMRQDLVAKGVRFRGSSDTEVLIEGIERWGIAEALRRTNGMFAFAVWDTAQREMHLARDRVGEKPLYYGSPGGAFLFGSTLDTLTAHPSFRGDIDRGALALFLRHSYVPAPYSIYRGVSKLPPGTYVTVDSSGAAADPVAYWSAREVADRGLAEPFAGSFPEAVDAVEELLAESVAMRMVADVPLGAFLSGGVDSSTVVALMQRHAARPVRTFSIGFHHPDYDEAAHAAAVARHLGTDHTEMYVTPEEARAVIPLMPMIYDEPFSDSSQIPTFLVSQLAHEDVTVALSGDGGDELFAGYTRYEMYEHLWRRLTVVPTPIRGAVAAGLATVPTRAWDRLAGGAGRVARGRAREPRFGDKVHKFASVLRVEDPGDIYRALVSHWSDPASVVMGGYEPGTPFTMPSHALAVPDLTARARFLDLVTYLPDDILVKVDRATMAVGLEARVPMLDHRLVELAWQMPRQFLVDHGRGKRVLREVLYRQVPRELVDRPKMGFGVPLGEWLQTELRDWAEDLLSPASLARDDLFDVSTIRQYWVEHRDGRRDWKYLLWDVLMFQAWRQRSHPASDCS